MYLLTPVFTHILFSTVKSTKKTLISLRISIWFLTENSQQFFAIAWKRRPTVKSWDRWCRPGRWVNSCTLEEPIEVYLAASSKEINLRRQSCHHRHITWFAYLLTASLTSHSDCIYSAWLRSFFFSGCRKPLTLGSIAKSFTATTTKANFPSLPFSISKTSGFQIGGSGEVVLFISRFRHVTNSSERTSPWPHSSTLNTSISDDLSFRLIFQTPSLLMVDLSPRSTLFSQVLKYRI